MPDLNGGDDGRGRVDPCPWDSIMTKQVIPHLGRVGGRANAHQEEALCLGQARGYLFCLGSYAFYRISVCLWLSGNSIVHVKWVLCAQCHGSYSPLSRVACPSGGGQPRPCRQPIMSNHNFLYEQHLSKD